MADYGFAHSTYRGAAHHSSQDRRMDYHCLNTIMEEPDSREASPTKPAGGAGGYQHALALSQQQQNSRLEQESKVELWLSPVSDHFPTPRGFHFMAAPVLPSSPSSASVDGEAGEEMDFFRDDESSPKSSPKSTPSSPWNRHRSISTDVTDFDDLYGADDDEDRHFSDPDDAGSPRKQRLRAVGISRRLSGSLRRAGSRPTSTFEASRRMLPQLTIPAGAAAAATAAESDAARKCASPMPPTPSAQVAMSPAIVSFMQKHHALDVPAVSAPPSLDGSMTSDQMSQMSAQISAPPTPIIGCADDEDGAHAWSGVQLQPGALATLHALARSDAGSVADEDNAGPDRVIEVPEPQLPAAEMAETPSHNPLRLITAGLPSALPHRSTLPFSPAQQRSLAGLTRLDIPSPGGFFSGLSPRTRHTWHLPGMTPVDSAHPPTSGTAEQFYRLPWASQAGPHPPLPERPLHMPQAETHTSPVEQVIEVAAAAERDDPVTAFRVQKTPLTAQMVPPMPATPSVAATAPAAATCTPPAARTASSATAVEPVEANEASSPVEELVATEIVTDYHAIDAQKLQQIALSQFDRTEMWLVAQRAYLSGVADMTEAAEEVRSPEGDVIAPAAPAVPPKDETTTSVVAAAASAVVVRKKTVRFSEGVKSPAVPRVPPSKLLHQESAYYRAFTDLVVRAHLGDMFIHRLPRFEALQSQRLLLRGAHRNQLLGKHQLTVVPQSAKKRMSANVVRGDDILTDDPAKLRADKEADALGQMAVASWYVAATKFLNGGRLFLAPVHKQLARVSRPAPAASSAASSSAAAAAAAAAAVSAMLGQGRERTRILDLGGQATCDWAWHVALQYPNTKVYSVTTKSIRQLSNANIRGPSNHRQVAVEKLTRLPFDDNQFDLVRASELYSILKFVGENGEDEWEACLHECYRVLKPDGYLEFSVMDSDLVNAGPLGNAKSVEFGFVLQTLGYDPSPSKMFLGRLDRAGFTGTRRAWTCLPVGPRPASMTALPVSRDSTGSIVPTVQVDAMVTGSTDNVAAITGLAGSWVWERWLLRAEMEKTAGELRLADTVTAGPALLEAAKSLDGIHAIVEEGRANGAGWRMLRGYTRKPQSDMGTINMMLDMGM